MNVETNGPPLWRAKVGVVGVFFSIVFISTLIVASLFGVVIPEKSQYLLSIMMALVAAMCSFLWGSHAVIKGWIPFSRNVSPFSFGIAGSVAAFIIVLIVMQHVVFSSEKHGPETLAVSASAPAKITEAGEEMVSITSPRPGALVKQFDQFEYKLSGQQRGRFPTLLIQDPLGQIWSWGVVRPKQPITVQFGLRHDSGKQFHLGVLFANKEIPRGTVLEPTDLKRGVNWLSVTRVD